MARGRYPRVYRAAHHVRERGCQLVYLFVMFKERGQWIEAERERERRGANHGNDSRKDFFRRDPAIFLEESADSFVDGFEGRVVPSDRAVFTSNLVGGYV